MSEEIKPEIDTPAILQKGEGGEVKEEEVAKKEKLLTQEQFNEALQDRLERERKKILKEAEEKIKTAQSEAERLAKLTAEEKQKEIMKKTEEEIRQREKEVALRENKIEVIEIFRKSNVPVDLVNYVISDDRDKTLENAENFVKNYKESVSQTVAEQLKGTPPKDFKTNSEPKKVITSF